MGAGDDIHSLDAAHAVRARVHVPRRWPTSSRFLVSDAAGYVTDQRIDVDGGTF